MSTKGTPPAPPSEDEINTELSLAVVGYDPKDEYPEWGNAAMREAYRAGWEDGCRYVAADASEQAGT